MKTDYHQKLADIEQSYETKDRALEKERRILQRDLDEAREDVRMYGDEFDETVEYGMVLPERISARSPVHVPELVAPQRQNDEQVWNPLPISH